MRRFECLIILLFCVTVAKAQIYFPPLSGNQWDTLSPKQLNWCEDSLQSVIQYVGENNSKALLILVDGKLVVEKYYGSFKQDSMWYWASAAKSLTACLVGIAADQKLLNLNDTSSKYLGNGWTNCTLNDEHKIKIIHQLSMSSGLNDNVPDVDCTDPSCLNCLTNPGTRWAYHNAPYTLLDGVISGASGQTLNLFLNNNLKVKTGMTGLFVKQGYNNLYVSNARSMARFGILALNNFIWNSDTIIKDSNYRNNMVNTSQTMNKSYGYLWWLNGKSSFMLPYSQFVFNGPLLPDAPSDLFSALGKNGQIINVIPSKKMVLIRIGDKPSDQNELPIIFNNNVWKKMNHVLACNTTSTDESIKSELKIYPNPANHYINIESPKEITTISLYNTLGQLQNIHFKENKIDVSNLPRGVYTIILSNSESSVIRKIIIQR